MERTPDDEVTKKMNIGQKTRVDIVDKGVSLLLSSSHGIERPLVGHCGVWRDCYENLR